MKLTQFVYCLFFSSFSWSQLVYVNTNDTIDIDLNNEPSFYYNLDINQDGINDFRLNHAASSSWSSLFVSGLTDSSDIIHSYFEVPSMSGYKALNMTDSTLSNTSNWMADYIQIPNNGSGILHSTFSSYVSDFLNQSVYFGIRFFVEDNDFLYKPHYGCIDATLTLNDRLIIHGWYYQNEANSPITCSDAQLIENSSLIYISHSEKKIIKFLDIMGREVNPTQNAVLIAVYEDGSTQKIFQLTH
jgi:hypothetical protein